MVAARVTVEWLEDAKGGLLFFICDIILVEVIYMHRLLHMTCTKELQKVSLELV